MSTFEVVVLSTVNIISIMINLFLFLLIKLKTRANIGDYKVLLLVFAAFEIFYSTVDLVVVPENLLIESGFVVYSAHGIFVGNKTLELLSILVFYVNYSASLNILALHFLYRYFSLCRHNIVILLRHPKYIFLVIISFILSQCICGMFFFQATPTAETETYLEQAILAECGRNSHEVGYIGPLYFYTLDTGETIINWRHIFAALSAGVLVSCTLVVVVVSGVLTYHHLKISVLSKRAVNLQNQLFRALIIQFLVPLVFTYLPTGGLFIVPLLSETLVSICSYSRFTVAIVPLVDPIITILFIRDYRQSTYRIFCRMKHNKLATITSHVRSVSNNNHLTTVAGPVLTVY